jgi:hypothetical protein
MAITVSLPGYAKLSVGPARGLVIETCLKPIEEILARSTLYDHARSQPDARSFQGRVPVYTLELDQCGSVVVRHAVRGGLLGSTGTDLFLPPTRGLRELVNSLRLRLSGVPTPEVVAIITYRAGPVLRRGDVATREIPESHDLAVVLREMNEPADRVSCLRAAGRLLGAMARAGAHHPDLNARNVLLTWDGADGAKAHILDVDRIRFHVPGDPMVASANMERLRRSLTKLRGQNALTVTDAEFSVIESASKEAE